MLLCTGGSTAALLHQEYSVPSIVSLHTTCFWILRWSNKHQIYPSPNPTPPSIHFCPFLKYQIHLWASFLNYLIIPKGQKWLKNINQIFQSMLKREVILIVFSFAVHHNSLLCPFSDISAVLFYINVYIAKEIKIHHCSLTAVSVTEEFLQHYICAIIPKAIDPGILCSHFFCISTFQSAD